MASVAIIGAGIAGLGLALRLVKSNFTNFTIFEAQEYAGGRIKSLPFEDSFLELGAQWIHGQEDNILYEFSKKNKLLAEVESVEGDGRFCSDDGHFISPDLTSKILMFLDSVKLNLMSENFATESDLSQCDSVGEVFRESFQKWIHSEDFSSHELKLLEGIFEWFLRFETIDNSCQSLDELSVLSYTTYRQCNGVPLNNLKNGYSSIINAFLKEIPIQNLKFNCPVKCVRPSICDKEIIVTIDNGEDHHFNHVVVTCSIGFLKNNLTSFFGKALPPEKTQIIESLGFGTVNKIYMVFDEPFWEKSDLGFQLVWLKDKNSYPSWVYDISGIDSVNRQPRVLVVWIGGQGAEAVENETDETLLDVLHRLLKQFVERAIKKTIPRPRKIFKTSWHSCPYVNGAYSNRPKAYERLNVNLKSLMCPVYAKHRHNGRSIDWPLILFAGEATSDCFFSTTHGALDSGYREADRLMSFWRQHELICDPKEAGS